MLSTSVVLIILAAVIGSGAMTLVLAWITHRVRSLELSAGGAELDRLAEQLNELRDDIQAANAGIANLTERLDFTERLLTDGRDRHPGASS